MKIINDFSHERVKQVHDLYKQVWWAKDRTLEDTHACVRGSQVCIGILDEADQLVGFVRVLSDFVFKALIFDVIVCSTYRGTGLGKKLMQQVETHDGLKKIKHFELYCLPEMESYYNSLGFSAEVGGVRLLRREMT
ncbi:GNAT family N-acetyltransferase [Photobacterium satsumensis]|uniref:GNAT family N-acetyltransferase n=1 Tax=Photobacterium satsumensis TaxID=2910239 RepID=UPI003D0BA1C0